MFFSFRKPYEKLKKCLKPLANCLNKICPCIRKLIFSPPEEHKACKRFFGFLYGLLIGLLFYEMVILELSFTPVVTVTFGIVISIALAFSIAFSRQIRCIALLSAPTLCGRAGRRVLRTMILTYLISGPITNMGYNGQEVARTFSCSMSLTYNLTKGRFVLMFAPIQNALLNMKITVAEVKDTIRSIQDVSAPIVEEIEDQSEAEKIKEFNDYLDDMMNDTRRSKENQNSKIQKNKKRLNESEFYREKYIGKIRLRCEEQMTNITYKCRKTFEKMYDSCYETVTFLAAWILCWPMKLNYVCNIGQIFGGSNICDPSKDIDPGMGSGYSYLKKAQDQLSKNFKNVNLQYKVQKVTQVVKKAQNAIDIAKTIMHDVLKKKHIILEILNVVKRLLVFVFLQIVLSAQSYHDKYLENIEFDNRYITKYFRKIDARRHKQGKYTLLPLKKVEMEKYVDPLSLRCLRAERRLLLSRCFKLVLEIITATVFIIVDRLFYESLDLIRRHAKIEFHQKGHHDLNIVVQGHGLIAVLVRSVVRGFNVRKRIRVIKSNLKCLPKPKYLEIHYLSRIYGTFAFLMLGLIVEMYLKRIKPVICGFYYRKKQKRRVLYLYNELLRKRSNFIKQIKKKLTRLIREQRLGERDKFKKFLKKLYENKFLFWIKFLPFIGRRCLVCEELEKCALRDKTKKFILCPKCKHVYCPQCWKDLDEMCDYCVVVREGVDSDHETDTEDSNDFVYQK